MKNYFGTMCALLIASFGCLAGEGGTSDETFLAGGFCEDDPLAIYQAQKPLTKGEPDLESVAFSGECVIQGKEQSLDAPPLAFSCRKGGKTALAGASYKKLKKIVIESDDEDRSDARVYVYECTNGCSAAPKKISYTISDCG